MQSKRSHIFMVLFFPFAIPSKKAQTSNKQPTICDLIVTDVIRLLCRRVGSGIGACARPRHARLHELGRRSNGPNSGSSACRRAWKHRSRRQIAPNFVRGSKRAEPRNPAGRPGLEKAHFTSNPATAHLISVTLYGLEDEEARH